MDGSLHSRISHDEPYSEADRKKCIPVSIEGPYEPASMEFLRYDNLHVVAGGIGVTPFLSIMREISCSSRNGRNAYPERINMSYTVKKSQDLCLLDPILQQLLDTEQFRIKLNVFVTKENQIGVTLREVLNEIPKAKVTNFSTANTTCAVHGPERLLVIAVVTVVSSAIFLLSLFSFNRFIIPPAKKLALQKNPSSQIDLLLASSFAIAIISGGIMATIIRWKRVTNELQLSSGKQSRDVKQSSLEAIRDLDEHEIHFGGRPVVQDIISSFITETSGSEIGVLVCGPTGMQEAVASSCKRARFSQKNAKGQKPNFSFHSLSFTLYRVFFGQLQ